MQLDRRHFLGLIAGTGAHLLAGPADARPPAPRWLRQELEVIRHQYRLPALSASLVIDGSVVAAAAVGLRKLGHPARTQVDDPFLIGSVSKPCTGMLIARLVDRGIMRWDMTIGEMFPELMVGAEPLGYGSATVVNLLSHRAGLRGSPSTPIQEIGARASTLPGKRYEYVKAALADPPLFTPGERESYASGGILAASAAERLTGHSYEQLMRTYLYRPLHMESPRFGRVPSRRVDIPWRHRREGGTGVDGPIAVFPPFTPNGYEAIGAPTGGNVAISSVDLGRLCAVQLRGCREESRFLSKSSFHVSCMPAIPGATASGSGWGLATVDWAPGMILWHNGSVGFNEALCHIVPEGNFATCVMTNIAGDGVDEACNEVNRFLARQVPRLR
jgi:CubicO group peptidase (beta-lactamase class C family)